MCVQVFVCLVDHCLLWLLAEESDIHIPKDQTEIQPAQWNDNVNFPFYSFV